MTVTRFLNTAGRTVGATINTTLEPFFSSFTGSPKFGANNGMVIDPVSISQAFDTARPGATSHYRYGWKIKFVSSTATITICQMLSLQNSAGTTIEEADLRNNAGTRELAGRDNFVAFGQTTGDPIPANAIWRCEWEYNAGAASFYIWKSENGTGTPDYTFTDPSASGTIAKSFFGCSASNVGVTAEIFDGWYDDTGASAFVPPGGSVVFAHDGFSTASSFGVVAKLSGASAARLKYSTDPTFATGSAFTTSAAPSAAGYQVFTPTGLSADTTYYWQVEVDGTLETSSAKTGHSNTLKSSSAPQSFTFGWGSCHDTQTSGVFALIAARSPHFYVQVGDDGYQYITGGPNGNTAPANTATCRTHREAAIGVTASPGRRDLYAAFPSFQMYSDCDGGGANSDGTFAGFVGGNVQAAWREQYAHGTLPLSDCGARSWVVGRVRFILTDETTLASDKTATDNSSKTKLGATQKAWWKSEVDAAAAAHQYVVWCGDGPIIIPANNTGSANSWERYNTERTELGNYIASAGMTGRIIRLHGDTHTLFADDGTNNPWGGFPCFSAAPMHTTAQAFGTTVSNGSFPSTTVNSSRQYGICTVTDSGGTLTLALKGYASTVSSPTETNPVSMTITALTRVTKTSATSWDVKARVSKTSATTYDVRARPAKTSATSYDIAARATKTATTSWDVRARGSKTAATTYDVLTRTAKTSATSYDVLTRASKTAATSWDVRARASKTATTTYDILTRSVKTSATSYDILTRSSKTSATTWDIRGRVSKTSATSWDLAGTLARVAGTYPTSWDVRSRPSKTHATTWDVRSRVAKTAAVNYDILSRAARTHATSWDSRARITKMHTTAWDVAPSAIGGGTGYVTVAGVRRPAAFYVIADGVRRTAAASVVVAGIKHPV